VSGIRVWPIGRQTIAINNRQSDSTTSSWDRQCDPVGARAVW
jgi:hypothetical protein